MFAGMKPLDPMVARGARAPRRGVKTGLVSNSWSIDHYDRELLGELFDDVVISGEVGMHKPAARDLPARPPSGSAWSRSACVFVDDLRENCEGAEAVGMTAIRHRDARRDDREARPS